MPLKQTQGHYGGKLQGFEYLTHGLKGGTAPEWAPVLGLTNNTFCGGKKSLKTRVGPAKHGTDKS